MILEKQRLAWEPERGAFSCPSHALDVILEIS